jgi:hypothetical protein
LCSCDSLHAAGGSVAQRSASGAPDT